MGQLAWADVVEGLVRSDHELDVQFEGLPESGKHYIKLIRSELSDLRHRVQQLEQEVASLRGGSQAADIAPNEER